MFQIAAPRIGIYVSLPKDSEIFNVTSSILGYDPYRIVEVDQDTVIAEYCGRAKTFGAHITIYDIFTPTDYKALLNKIKKIVKNFQPFTFTFSRFAGYVRGDYQGKSVYNTKAKTVLGLDIDVQSISKFKALHKEITINIQPYRLKIEPEFNSNLFRNTLELWPLIEKYGAPYVLSNYAPHLTLASKLDGSEELCKKLITYLNTVYGRELLNIPISLDRICIFEEIVHGKYAGYFKVIEEVHLGN